MWKWQNQYVTTKKFIAKVVLEYLYDVEPRESSPDKTTRHIATPTTVSPRNDVRETSLEIPYGWRVTTQIWIVLLIGWIKFQKPHDKLETLPMGSDASSERNFCARFSNVNSQGNRC